MKTTLAAGSVAALAGTARAADAGPSSQILELRSYRLRAGAGHALLDGYLEKALIPALNARGVEAVGAFTEPDAKDGAAVWVLIPHPSMESVVSIDSSINEDGGVQAAGMDYLSRPTKENPAFDRIDSWIFLPFSGLPRLVVPQLAKDRKARVFEMRTYESYSELKALKKVAMFNAGEIGVMQEVDLSPVFYGQALVGRDLPHLTYMLCSSDLATHKRNWDRFLAHPVWKKLLNDPQYADTVQKITSRFLVPTEYSQV
ncbi:MAG TPA: NIPSNAP family protein [Opitutaceae bacterium]